jgi:signal transduction histidine kinase/tetratricopeptide (TPR) repeat protein
MQELEAAIKNAATEQEHINALTTLAGALLHTDEVRALKLADEAYERATSGTYLDKPYQKGLADSLYVQARLKTQLSDYVTATSLLVEALLLYLELGDRQGEAQVRFTIGGIHYDMGNFLDSLECELEVCQIAKETSNQEQLAAATNVIGLIYSQLNDPQTALAHFQRCLLIYQATGQKTGEADVLDNIGDMSLVLGEHDDALKYAQQSLALCKKTGYRQGEAKALDSLGDIYTALTYTGKALAFHRQCLTLCQEIGHKYLEVFSLVKIGNLHCQGGDATAGLEQLKQALVIGQTVNSSPQLATIHKALAETYKQLGDFEQALAHHEHFYAAHQLGQHESVERRLRTVAVVQQSDALNSEAEAHRRKNATLEQEVARRTQAETKLQGRLDQMMTVLQVFDEVSRTLDVDYVQLITLDAASRLSGADAGFVALRDGEKMQVSRAIGQYTPEEQKATLNVEHPLLKRIFDSRHAEMFHDLTESKTALPTLSDSQARIIIPMISRDRCVGLVNLETKKPERFDKNVFRLLRLLEQYMSVALDNAQLYQQVHAQLAELQALYEQVSQLEQLKSDMIRVAAHDLRNPLAVIYGNLKLFSFDRDKLKPNQKEYLDAIHQSAVRMKTMMEDILSLERIEQMAQTASGELFDLSQQVKKAAKEYKLQAKQKAQQFEAQMELQGLPMVQGDIPQIYEAIANLIGNAIKYTPEKGQIQVSLKSVAGQVIFEVTDTGYGIPENMQERLFQPFYRAKTDETASIEGTGLGLHLVKNIIERHNGEMIFRSTYGEGSTFGFTLPMHSD